MDDYGDINDALVDRMKAKVLAYNRATLRIIREGIKSEDALRDLMAAYRMPESVSGFKL